MRNVKLNNLGRLLIIPVLQKAEGNILAVKQIKELIPKVGFSEKEIEEKGLVSKNGGVSWKKDSEIELTIGNTVYDLLKKQVEQLSKTGKISLQWLDLVERILTKEDYDKMLKRLEEKEKGDVK